VAAADYQNVIERGTGPGVWGATPNGMSALIDEDVAKDIIDGVIEQSAVLSLAPHMRMSKQVSRMPVFSALPSAYWITGDTGLLKTSEVSWKNKFLQAEDMGVIVPIPKKVLEDSGYDVWGTVKPRLQEAIAVLVDKAVLFGLDKPSSWPDAICTGAIAAGNTTTRAGSPTIDVLDEINTVMGQCEADGFDPNGFWYKLSLRPTLRGLRDGEKRPMFSVDGTVGASGVAVNSIWGLPARTTKLGSFEAQSGSNKVELITGDWSNVVLGIRHDLEFDIWTEATIFDDTGAPAFNLAQQQMVALYCTFRMAYQIANPTNRMNTQEFGAAGDTGEDTGAVQSSDRYPFAVLRATA
jgi:HK97 family phage major capsid protein